MDHLMLAGSRLGDAMQQKENNGLIWLLLLLTFL